MTPCVLCKSGCNFIFYKEEKVFKKINRNTEQKSKSFQQSFAVERKDIGRYRLATVFVYLYIISQPCSI